MTSSSSTSSDNIGICDNAVSMDEDSTSSPNSFNIQNGLGSPSSINNPDSSDTNQSVVNNQIQQDQQLYELLAQWRVRYGLRGNVVNALLSILRLFHPHLPKDNRTLTPIGRKEVMTVIGGGHFHYFGLVRTLVWALQRHQPLASGTVLKLQLNIDGLKPYKGSKSQFWPLLGRLEGLKLPVFLIGLFYGRSKPTRIDEYLDSFINEYLTVQDAPIIVKGRELRIMISTIVCDAPALAQVKCIKGPGGYYACHKCAIRGRRNAADTKTIYTRLECNPRTDASFRTKLQPKHHLPAVFSPFIRIELGKIRFIVHFMRLTF